MQRIFDVLGLRTPTGRIMFFMLASALIFISPYELLTNLSLWQRIGFDQAPSIGLTRAYWHVLHGQFYDAWVRNRLIYVVLAIGIPLLTSDAIKIYKAYASKQ